MPDIVYYCLATSFLIFAVLTIVISVDCYKERKGKTKLVLYCFYLVAFLLAAIFSIVAPKLLTVPLIPIVIWFTIGIYECINEGEYPAAIFGFVITLLLSLVIIMF